MRGIISKTAVAALLAALVAAGCSAGPLASRATTDSCYEFGVHALRQHITVTAVPPACAGLSPEQVNQAVGRAIRDVVGPLPKAAERRAAYHLRGYLARLISTVPPAKAPPPATQSHRQSTGLPLSLAALAAWILTAAAGGYLLAGWLAEGNRRLCRARAGAARAPAIILSHFGLAVAGLILWIVFVVTNFAALAWAAAGAILVIAGLGMASLVTALPEPAADTAPASLGSAPVATLTAPATVRMPVTVIAVHGILATATILFVILAAVGAS